MRKLRYEVLLEKLAQGTLTGKEAQEGTTQAERESLLNALTMGSGALIGSSGQTTYAQSTEGVKLKVVHFTLKSSTQGYRTFDFNGLKVRYIRIEVIKIKDDTTVNILSPNSSSPTSQERQLHGVGDIIELDGGGSIMDVDYTLFVSKTANSGDNEVRVYLLEE